MESETVQIFFEVLQIEVSINHGTPNSVRMGKKGIASAFDGKSASVAQFLEESNSQGIGISIGVG
jgi:hypothetical protein